MADKYSPWLQVVGKVSVKDKTAQLHGGEDEKELDSWLEKFDKELLPLIKSNDKKLSATLHKYNKDLLSRTFLVSNHITLADLVFYVSIHPIVAAWSEKDRVIFVNITRWFDHVQYLVESDGAPAHVQINPDCVPFEPKKKVAEQKQQQKKEGEKKEGEKKEGEKKEGEKKEGEKKEGEKKEGEKKEGDNKNKKGGNKKAPASVPVAHIPESQDKREEAQEKEQKLVEEGVRPPAGADDVPTPSSSSSTSHEGGDKKGKGKEKQPQQPKQAQAKKPAAKEEPRKLSANVDISRLDIRVGFIKTCRRHENAERLYIEEIDLGEETGPRQIVSGLVQFIPLDQMVNRLVLVLANLKPANLKSVKSNGMVLAASNEDHTQVELVDPPAGAKIGERVFFPGFEGDAEKVAASASMEAIFPDLKSNAERVATYKGVPFTTSAGVCTVKSIVNGGIK